MGLHQDCKWKRFMRLSLQSTFWFLLKVQCSANVLCVLTPQAVPVSFPNSAGLFPLRHNYKRGYEKLLWVKGLGLCSLLTIWSLYRSFLIHYLRGGVIMDPEGGSLALSKGKSEMKRRFWLLYRCLLTAGFTWPLFGMVQDCKLKQETQTLKRLSQRAQFVSVWPK